MPDETAFYIVVRHRADPSQRYANDWRDARTLVAFTTPKKVAKHAVESGTIFVHRCGFGEHAPAVVCEARVLSAMPIDSRESLVQLEPLRIFEASPPATPQRGQNFYWAPPVS